MDFFSAYKELRNRIRKYRPRSIVRTSMGYLWHPVKNKLEELEKHPWQVLLLVKWTLEDTFASDKTGRDIKDFEFDELRQRLFDFPERISLWAAGSSARLFMRQLLHAQIAFQRDLSPSFTREAALLAKLAQDHPLRLLFLSKTGLEPLDFIDLAIACYAAVLNGRRTIGTNWFSSLRLHYGDASVDAFIQGASRNYDELVAFCRGLPDAKRRRTSEFYEFTPLKRFPFLRTEGELEYWHPIVFFRGMEGFVHSVLSEAGQDYIERFSKVFERHVLNEIGMSGLCYFNEAQLKAFCRSHQKVPDALVSFPDMNLFIESKAGLFDESVMTVGHSEILAHKTRALQTAIAQGWATSIGLREARLAPAQVLNAPTDYLLVVTNRELNASRGTTLREMYPEGKLDYPSVEASIYLPLERVYFISIDDFERLMAAARSAEFEVPSFLEKCVELDSDPATAKYFFEQHLNALRVPMRRSPLLSEAIDCSYERIKQALGSSISAGS